MFLTYVALVHKAEKKSTTYGVIFPDFPGCVFAGANLNEALENARKGLIFHMEGILDTGQRLPEATPLETIVADPENKDAIPCFIHLVPPLGRLKRVNISIDAGLLAEIDHAARLRRKNRSEFLAEAAQQMLA